MPSAANANSDKTPSTEVTDNSPIRQIMTIIEHKIRNLEKRKSKLTSYRDLQKAGKELKADQKVAVAKFDEVAQTLEFARDLSKQVTSIAVSSERDAKKQAKKEAWVRYAADTNKIREVLMILDCLMQMGSSEARDDFLNGTNGAAKLTEEDLKILDDLYPEVTPKHEINEEGLPAFQIHTAKAAEHLYAIIDGKPKEFLGTTYAHIKEIVTAVHGCGYFDKVLEQAKTETEVLAPEEAVEVVESEVPAVYPSQAIPVPPSATVVPAPAYPLRPLPPITLQEVEHAYFSQQYPQHRPISEVIGSQNFFFLQESEIDSPVGTPQPPILNQGSPPGPIPTQTFTNQHFVPMAGARPGEPMPMPPQPHFPPHPEHGGFTAVPVPHPAHVVVPQVVPQHSAVPQSLPPQPNPAPVPTQEQSTRPPQQEEPTPADSNEGEWKDTQSPEHEDGAERKTQGQGDGQRNFKRFGRGRGTSNGYRGRGSFQRRSENNDNYHRHDYQNRSKDGYQTRQYNDNYQRHSKDYNNRGNDYYGNGDSGNDGQNENGSAGRERYGDNQSYGGFRGRGRGAPKGSSRPSSRPPRPHYNRKQENAD